MQDTSPRIHQAQDRPDSDPAGFADVTADSGAIGTVDRPAQEAPPSIVVIGIGNTLLGDDGVGVHVVEQLRERNLDKPIAFFDGGTLSFSLLEHIESADRLIIVDAAYLDSPPGTVAVFRNAELEHFLTTSRRPSVHEVNLLDVLGAARLRGRLPAEYALVAIEPGVVDWSSQPSPAVAPAVEEASERVTELIEAALP
ncbi:MULTISPECIES: HyaD/HybD family hydrogenase maturation endopeptidase [unclassified Wenzhouxiangella]|uniref:HyaD/HybD family hydrogenase maturation endopeptidase n=1 Tax=unclassified Wenzhouxiangella TaxID=2613841 RepID=UPI000E32560A|nr:MULTISPECIES: HyaD/HybD family hydrogenase maturation endopeptidase [unclassified Wenzhouxiangella]RFF28069.1 hydrogenase maturation protease [Wenzhouxiangella sp. 15181]RFP68655.1 hydrogenase maturation protease [Wenzhouxiangella sp. 15190]